MKGRTMKRLLPVIALLASGCDRQPQPGETASTPAATEAALPGDARKSQPPSLVPMPADQKELDRMILAGFTPHADHLHAPGVKSCPLAQGNEAVM
jgi:hypothetical protein